MKTVTRALMVVGMALFVVGCKTNRGDPRASDADAATGTNAADAATASGDGSATSGAALESAGSVGAGAGSAGPQGELLSRRLVYFDFDSADIRAEDRTLVAAHAQYLVSNPGTRLRLEGHSDERGTREYNIGLGERRAQSVRRTLMLQGVTEGQLTTVSYGEERPAAAGEDEAAHAQNRRVELMYGN